MELHSRHLGRDGVLGSLICSAILSQLVRLTRWKVTCPYIHCHIVCKTCNISRNHATQGPLHCTLHGFDHETLTQPPTAASIGNPHSPFLVLPQDRSGVHEWSQLGLPIRFLARMHEQHAVSDTASIDSCTSCNLPSLCTPCLLSFCCARPWLRLQIHTIISYDIINK